MERPLLTFLVVAFNQEQFIRQAVEGALAQTYSPLQVILSDDGSHDGTHKIMVEIVEAYRGPHQIVLNRNPRNLGVGSHLNRVMELAKGHLIIGSAGDDISLPERTEVLWHAWEESGRTACSLCSAMRLIDESGADHGVWDEPPPVFSNDFLMMCQRGMPGVAGAAHAWDRRIFDLFGPLQPDVVYEDRALPFRSMLLGKIVYVKQPLVLYRRHGEAITCQNPATWSPAQERQVAIKRARQMQCVFRQWLLDLAKAPQAPSQTAQAIAKAMAEMRFYEALQQDSLATRGRGFFYGVWAGVRWRFLLRVSLLGFGRPFHDWWLTSHKGIDTDYWTRMMRERRPCGAASGNDPRRPD